MRLVVLFVLAACRVSSAPSPSDRDGDGVTSATDCNDAHPATFPGADELCDGLDNDCDGAVDEDAVDVRTFYADADGDLFGAGDPILACFAPDGAVAVDGDCADGDPDTHPLAVEWCDGEDNDCSDAIDDHPVDGARFYVDADDDGYGGAPGAWACAAPEGEAAVDGDCDDDEDAVNPGATETCATDDDDDCDGDTDDASDGTTAYYVDLDGDGHGAGPRLVACAAPEGAATLADDCDDTDSFTYPGATERCDGRDNDCDAQTAVDAGAPGIAWYADADGDGFGAGDPVSSCTSPGSGYALLPGDCADGDDARHPGAPETCNATDDDCDGDVDEHPTDGATLYADGDGDGQGAGAAIVACAGPGLVATSTDCDDTDRHTYVGAPERCDGVSNDCDVPIDESPTDGVTWYADADGDRFGDASAPTVACRPPAGAVADATDCDDDDPAVHPGATEVCDGVRNDCAGAADQGAVDALAWFADTDADGWGDPDTVTRSCTDPGTGYALIAGDCNPSSNAVFPGAPETCNQADDDCDGVADDDPRLGPTWYLDADGDGFGTVASIVACTQPQDYVAVSGDCDDGAVDTFPGAPELCDGVDQDCNDRADDTVLGASEETPARSCAQILAAGCGSGDGLYWVDPSGQGDPWQAACDMTRDGGGWTRLFGSEWPRFWLAEGEWQRFGTSVDANFSRLEDRAYFAEDGQWTFRFEVGDGGSWSSGNRDHFTVWTQGHDPFTESTTGADHAVLLGAQSTTCGGFNGLHDALWAGGSQSARASDPDSGDAIGCWWMQVVPGAQHNPTPGKYIDGYGGAGGVHTWQTLWMRGPAGDGSSEGAAATSCNAILRVDAEAPSDVYWIDPDGPGVTEPFEAWCDMDRDGGGWTLLATLNTTNSVTTASWPAWAQDWWTVRHGDPSDPGDVFSNQPMPAFRAWMVGDPTLRVDNDVAGPFRYTWGFRPADWDAWNTGWTSNTVNVIGPFNRSHVRMSTSLTRTNPTTALVNGHWHSGTFFLGTAAGGSEADSEGRGARYQVTSNQPGQFGYVADVRADRPWRLWLR